MPPRARLQVCWRRTPPHPHRPQRSLPGMFAQGSCQALLATPSLGAAPLLSDGMWQHSATTAQAAAGA